MREGAAPAYMVYSGLDIEGHAYRIVSKCPPSADDFLSYVMAGRNYPAKMFFRATSVSMFMKLDEAKKIARGGKFGDSIAEVDLADARIFLALTNEQTGHLSVWGRPRFLLERVVNCAEEGNW
ncbi:MAG TPA: hypothetical protein VF101_03705 [Gaiellaceae bacterium]